MSGGTIPQPTAGRFGECGIDVMHLTLARATDNGNAAGPARSELTAA
jgi:hypothetical protein